MATTPIIPASGFTFTVPAVGKNVGITPAVTAPGGSAENISSWVSPEANVISAIAVAASGPFVLQTVTTGITLNSDGTIEVLLDATTYNTIAPGGTLNLSIYAKPTSGDPLQLIAAGQITAALF